MVTQHDDRRRTGFTRAEEELAADVAWLDAMAGDVVTSTNSDIRAMVPAYLARTAARLRADLDTGRFRLDPM